MQESPTPVDVTLALLMYERLRGEAQYTPSPGTRYEVGPGSWVEMLPPTRKLAREWHAKKDQLDSDESDEQYPDYVLARMATKGEWPDPDELLDGVVAAIVVDFASASSQITRSEIQLYRASDLLNVLDLAKLLTARGQNGGDSAATDATTLSGSSQETTRSE